MNYWPNWNDWRWDNWRWDNWHFDQKIYQFFKETLPKKYAELQKMIYDVAIPILITLPLLYLDNAACSIGFTLGFIFERKAREIEEKVDKVYRAFATTRSKKLLLTATVISAVYMMPAVKMITALYLSSLWGARLSYWSNKKAENLKSQQTEIN